MCLLKAREAKNGERGQLLALKVFDERGERHLFVGDVELLVGRNGAEAFDGSLTLTCRRKEATEGFELAVPSDDLVARTNPSDRYRLKKPVLADARHQFGEGRLVHLYPRLVGISVKKLAATLAVGF